MLVGHRVADDTGGQLVLPQQLAGVGIARFDEAVQCAVEGQAAGRRHGAAPDREALGHFPLVFAADRVIGLDLPGTQVVLTVALRSGIHPQGRAYKELARAIGQHEGFPIHADVVDAHHEQFALGVVAVVTLIVIAHRRGTDVPRLVIHPRGEFRVAHRQTGVELNGFHPVHGVVELVGRDQIAGFTVQRVDDAVAIGMSQQLAHLAVLVFLLGEHHDVDAGVVPFIVGGLLIAEMRFTGIDIAAPDGHGPLVVARAHGFVPGRRVARTVVEQVGVRIERIPAPVGAAADLPRLAFPGLETQPGLAVVRIVDVEIAGQQDVLIRAGRIGAPALLAGMHVIGGDIAAHTEFSARGADQHHVLDDIGRDGQRGTDLDVGILHLPAHFAAFGVQRHDMAVELSLHDQRAGFAIAGPVGQTAVDHVAAGHGASGRALLGLVLPHDSAGIVQIDGKRGVGERRVDVHHPIHDQRCAFVTVQNAGRERPGRAQIAHVLFVDLGHLAVIASVVIAASHYPVFRVFGQLDQLVVGRGPRGGQSQPTDEHSRQRKRGRD